LPAAADFWKGVDMEFVLTFFEGMASFLSPCIVPMLPVYAIYFASTQSNRKSAVARAVFFVLGYAVVFVSLGVAAGFLGSFVSQHRTFIRVFCGAAMCALGVLGLGFFHVPAFAVNAKIKITGVVSAFAFGMVYSLCIMPCVGAFLGAALMQAANEGTAGKGAILLSAYSLGLGVPFILTAVFINELKHVLTFIKSNLRKIQVLCSALLMLTGILYAVGLFDSKVEVAAEKLSVTEKTEVKKMAINITSSNFEQEVLKSEIPVIVDFWAEWCGPCKMIAPVLDEIASEKAGIVKVCKINVDEAPELAQQFGVASIPTVLLVRNANETARSIGYKTKEGLLAALGL
jgi:cytochrome c-type biogenesis protein